MDQVAHCGTPKRQLGTGRPPAYWWNYEIGVLRDECLKDAFPAAEDQNNRNPAGEGLKEIPCKVVGLGGSHYGRRQ